MNDLRNRLDAMKAGDALHVTPARRTRYAIRLHSGLWAGHYNHWVERAEDAVQFDFMTSAAAFAACVLDLSVQHYTVEAV